VWFVQRPAGETNNRKKGGSPERKQDAENTAASGTAVRNSPPLWRSCRTYLEARAGKGRCTEGRSGDFFRRLFCSRTSEQARFCRRRWERPAQPS